MGGWWDTCSTVNVVSPYPASGQTPKNSLHATISRGCLNLNATHDSLSENGVQRFLLRPHLFIPGLRMASAFPPRDAHSKGRTHRVLALQGTNEPPQYLFHSILLRSARGDVGEEFGPFAPVGREFGEGCR